LAARDKERQAIEGVAPGTQSAPPARSKALEDALRSRHSKPGAATTAPAIIAPTIVEETRKAVDAIPETVKESIRAQRDSIKTEGTELGAELEAGIKERHEKIIEAGRWLWDTFFGAFKGRAEQQLMSPMSYAPAGIGGAPGIIRTSFREDGGVPQFRDGFTATNLPKLSRPVRSTTPSLTA
jgi:hypothetical protein